MFEHNVIIITSDGHTGQRDWLAMQAFMENVRRQIMEDIDREIFQDLLSIAGSGNNDI